MKVPPSAFYIYLKVVNNRKIYKEWLLLFSMAYIIVFEDEPLNREFLKDVLGLLGHSFELFSDGSDENLEKLLGLEYVPDCFMLDYNMPVRNGYEVAELLRKNPKYTRLSRVPILGIGDFPKNKQEHLVDNYPKPWGVKILRERITDAIKFGEALKSKPDYPI